MKKSHYRADIDGLRALAIILVLFFHLKMAGFSGGFIGVDIFFVISGFLITSIIVRELNEDRFSLIKFWERRIRRILPVLFVVLLATTIASYFITLFPPDFTNFGQSLAAQGLLLVNIFFMRTGDYFAAPSDVVTLLHTWSLAVEEQFYVVFPLVLLLIFKLKKQLLVPLLTFFGILSLAYSLYLVNENPNNAFSVPFIPHVWGGANNANAGFYFPLARAWELIAGALLATSSLKIKNKVAAESVALIGIGTIFFGIFYIADTNPFPGLWGTLPVLGTAAIILANTNHSTFVSKILSFPVLVWTGLLSYSLYLWHWPIIVLTQQYLNGPITPSVRIWVLLATVLLSIASYFLIETPLRKKSLLPKTWHIFCFALFSTILIVSLGVTIVKHHGFPKRAPTVAQAVAIAAANTNPREYECFRNNYRQIFGEIKPCVIGTEIPGTAPTFVLWGDSHSNAAMPVFDKVAKENGVYGVFFAAGGCPPLVVTGHSIRENPQCVDDGHRALKYITDNQIRDVFLVSSWDETYPYFDDKGSTTILEALTETIEQIPPTTQVHILQRIPRQPDFQVRQLFYAATSTNAVPAVSVNKAEFLSSSSMSRQAIETLAREHHNVSVIDAVDIYCPQTTCPITHDGTIIYADSNHLNTTGVLLMSPLITPLLK